MSSSSDQSKEEGSSETTIWNTLADPPLLRHPLLQVAFQIVLENLEGCLSRSYRDVDKKEERDHKRVLLNLPGSFSMDGLNEGVYAVPRAGVGIVFNKTLIEHSTDYLITNYFKSKPTRIDNSMLGRMLDDMNILTYVAIIQQTLEHELGHLKYHCEGFRTDNDGEPDFGEQFEKETPEKLRHEAGYAVQQRIREDNFGEDVRSADGCRILDLDGDGDARFLAPVLPVFEYLEEQPENRKNQFGFRGDESEDDEAEDQSTNEPVDVFLSKQELLEYMEYPTGRCSKKRKRDDDGIDISVSPPDERDPPSGGGTDQDPSSCPSSGRNMGSWDASVRSFLPTAIRKAGVVNKAGNQKTMSASETDPDGNDHLRRRPKKGSLFKNRDIGRCRCQIMFCDKERNDTTTFTPSDHIFLRLKVTNPTKKAISIGIGSTNTLGSFDLRIDGVKAGWTAFCRLGWKVLEPRGSYTFFREFAVPERRDCNAYRTPPPGQYIVRAWVGDKSIEGSESKLCIVRRSDRT